MRCVSCDEPIYRFDEPCPHCQFQGEPALIEELAHVNWVLSESGNWEALAAADRHKIVQGYVARQHELEIKLGLRLPPFTEEEAHKAWPERFRREALVQQLADWQEAGFIHPAAASAITDEARDQIDDLIERLEGHARLAYHQDNADRLALTDLLLEIAGQLSQSKGFVTPEAENQVLGGLRSQKENLEIKLGLRPAPEPSPRPAQEVKPPESAAPPSPPPPAAPAIPFRDRLWRTLLSERTQQVLLFLGIFVTFSSAIAFVIIGWKDYAPPWRVLIPTIFTAAFFFLGWYFRIKRQLYRTGIAWSAIAALLIPIDFYMIYANFDIPPDSAPLFWLITSLICLIAYIVVTLLIRNPIFGYLVGAAAGGVVLAIIEMCHQHFGLSRDWRTAGLSGLAVCLTLVATLVSRRSKGETARVFAEPFRTLSLLTVGALMPLTFGWRYIDRSTYDTLHNAMTVNWWLGGFTFGWGAIHYRSRSLGLLAAVSLPIAAYMAQAAIFHQTGINPAWHALGWSLLTPLYFVTGHKLQARKDDPVLCGHGRTAAGWGVALVVVAAFWSLTDLTRGTAVASSHAVLCGSVVLAALLWQRPKYLYAASLLSLSAVTFAMTELDLRLSQLALGWVSLSIAHIIVAINVGERSSVFAGPPVVAGYVIAALALVPPLFPYDGNLLAYTLGNWLGLAAWGARLAHLRQPGFTPLSSVRTLRGKPGRGARSLFHWLTALPLPIWIWILFANRGPLDFSFPLALAVLAWGMVALSYRLNLLRANGAYRWPWYLTGLLVSVAAPIVAFDIAPDGFTPALCLLSAGLLYITDAVTNRQSWELAPGGLVTAWGYVLLLDRLRLTFDALSLALALLIAAYFLAGLWTERKRSPVFTHRFLTPLYFAAHVLSLVLLWRIYVRPLNDLLFNTPWTDEMRVWGAVNQLLLGIVYVLYAWGTYSEWWGHVAAWLIAAGGGFIAVALSEGRGSSAAKGALGVIAFILAERGLYRLRQRRGVRNRQQAFIRLAWRLFRRPLLATGWIASAGVIGLAFVRNLWLLGGGRIQQIWAAAGLALITGLYALSARLFRQAHFAWLAALLVLAPWTILTNLGWFVSERPTTPGFALSWVVLAWALYLVGLMLNRLPSRAYALPCKTVAYVLLPFSLLWGVAHVNTSRFTFALAIGFYGLGAALDYRRSKTSEVWNAVKFLYPALGLIPVWCVYLMAWLLPAARHEHYGLMLLAFGSLGLVAGQWLERVAPRREAASSYALPAYLTGYVSAIVGTLLVAHDPPLLALALLYDALLMLISARLFCNPLWVYPAAAMVPLSLLLALSEAQVAADRQGWWLIGLAAIYLGLAWALRRIKLSAYGMAMLTVGFALIALGLPPSSQDKTGALWGYGSAALLYAISALWLRQPLLLTPACALAIVPYAIGLQQSALRPEYYGLALFPGAIAALAMGWRTDRRWGDWRGFPWGNPACWARASAERLANWWGLPFYALGFGMAAASPFFTNFQAGLSALNWLLLTPLFGWAIYRFRLRVWLLAMAAAGHLAALYYLQWLGWWRYPAYAWLRFLPVTLLTTAAAVWIERRRHEGPPSSSDASFFGGWSRPLYALALLDVVAAQALSLSKTDAGAWVTLTHALLMAALASFWLSRWMPYISATLGIVALLQWLSTLTGPIENLPIALAYLALGYGLVGHGVALINKKTSGISQDLRRLPVWLAIWEQPLRRFSVWLSFAILALSAWLGVDLVGWTFRAMLGFPFRQIVKTATAQMWVGVFSLLGLLYVATAFTHRRLRLAYIAVGMLLAAWMTHAFYVQQWDGASQVQWYAMPAGLYLLGIGYLEWQRGNKTLARWLEYAAVLLMMGSLFWQTLLFGWRYALMLGCEGFAAIWWGSARRLRRFLYAGMMGVILAIVAQLLNARQSVNLWIVLGVIGLSIIIAGALIERRIKTWRQVLESWE